MILSTPFPIAHRPKATPAALRPQSLLIAFLLALTCGITAPRIAQAQTPDPASTPAPANAQTPAPAAPVAPPPAQRSGEVTEDELKAQFVGKPLFLRGSYLGDSLSFTQRGDPIGHPVKGSYTLSGVQIEKVNLTKHKVEFEGARYALHFLGVTPYEDSSKAVDRVKITPKKKTLKITIDRERVMKAKKVKGAKDANKDKNKSSNSPAPPAPGKPVASSETDSAAAGNEPEKEAENAADQAADPASVTTTLSPAHAATQLREALDKIFAPSLDDKVRAQMPEFWQLYYQAQTAGTDYRPKDASVLRPSAVDSHAKLTSSITPDSNEFAQANGIAGSALYRAVIGSDGKVGEIAVVRPIGFGLDENAVTAIRKATFQPATKSGQPVAETLDLAVVFRIYSKRTSVAASETGTEAKPSEPVKPGPYSVKPKPSDNQ
jgi:TonB family protein